ncbi:acyl-CoA-binding domain-containing protein 6 isoform X5 [Mastomys coucha]|uniref:acyl-CoA-binding domain-containing protein 6 isoform X5 n=1 Tax=Mastomys coucha TaxID=35658 RepID=UPI001262A81C|nr:acyl-CoA-binding domain-containing protein 6 isoform X5 [Mastomys coucha]
MATPFLPAGATTGDSGGELSSGDDSGDMESFQTPEAEATRSLAELFEKAAAHVQGLVQVASREQLLYLYARYKQVKVGNCNIPKPNFFDFEGKQKWEAWKALSDSSPSQAMQEYIAAVRKLDPGWNPQVVVVRILCDKRNLKQSLSRYWWSGSQKSWQADFKLHKKHICLDYDSFPS